ncbi:MAG: peptidoglycan DD-metalloendopeptidase family protein, partial [Burkholderiales bacterium]
APIINATQMPSYLKPSKAIGSPATSVAKLATPSKPVNTQPKLAALSAEDRIESTPVQIQPPAKPEGKINASQETQTIVAIPPATSSILTPNRSDWVMPSDGIVSQKFSVASKGIDIVGKEGQPIYAINSGKVAYSGNGLKGYGNLIIIKHDGTYLSAYAHNKVNLVKEGTMVKRGQKIAEMGSSGGKAILHLELRKNGKPIDPLSMIKL